MELKKKILEIGEKALKLMPFSILGMAAGIGAGLIGGGALSAALQLGELPKDLTLWTGVIAGGKIGFGLGSKIDCKLSDCICDKLFKLQNDDEKKKHLQMHRDESMVHNWHAAGRGKDY